MYYRETIIINYFFSEEKLLKKKKEKKETDLKIVKHVSDVKKNFRSFLLLIL